MKALKIGIKRRLLNRSLKSFEKRLDEKVVSPEKVEELFHRLSVIANGLKQLESLSPFARPDISADLDHVVSLYGKIVSLSQDHEVSAIQKSAQNLEEKISKNDCTALAHEVDKLRSHIKEFCANNLPSKEGRQILSYARNSTDWAVAFLQNKPWAPLPKVAIHGEDEEFADELFEIGYLFFLRKFREGTRAFNQLPERVKQRSYTHLVELGGNPFDLGMDVLKWQQALIATGIEITQSGVGTEYLKKEDVDSFFQERHTLDA